jgi:hypothetical protein
MSFENKLESYYAKNASQADMHGWGLSGGKKSHSAMHGAGYEDEIKKAVYGHGIKDGAGGRGLSGGRRKLRKSHGGTLSAGAMGYPARYPGSFPMPGFYPAEPIMTEAKRMSFIDGLGLGSGAGLSGGTGTGGVARQMKKHKSPAKVAAGKKAASENPWLKKIAAYRQEHGVSQKQAMIALGKR